MDYETITYEIVEPGIGLLSLNRPQAYNAVNRPMMRELNAFWAARVHDERVNVIILKGSGKGFCAGLDLKDSAEAMANLNMQDALDYQIGLTGIIAAMRKTPQPIIAVAHGAAMGLGFSFTLAADMRVIADDARFSAAYINVGLGGADMACSYLLPRMIGTGRAYEMMLTGETLTAAEVMGLGLASRMAGRDNLMETALELARVMLTKNPLGLRLTKQAINTSLNAGSLEQAIQTENLTQVFLAAKAMLESGRALSSTLENKSA